MECGFSHGIFIVSAEEDQSCFDLHSFIILFRKKENFFVIQYYINKTWVWVCPECCFCCVGCYSQSEESESWTNISWQMKKYTYFIRLKLIEVKDDISNINHCIGSYPNEILLSNYTNDWQIFSNIYNDIERLAWITIFCWTFHDFFNEYIEKVIFTNQAWLVTMIACSIILLILIALLPVG